MKIILPAHHKQVKKVKNWRSIKDEAIQLHNLILKGGFKGDYSDAFAISHAQVSENPKDFFVINSATENNHFLKQFKHWCIINPVILKMYDPVLHTEACMSWPYRKPKPTQRFNKIKVRYYTPSWFGILRRRVYKFNQLPAFMFQHESEHSAGRNIYGK